MNPEYSDQDEFYQKHLRAFHSDLEKLENSEAGCFGSIPELFSVFRQTTGYDLCFTRSKEPIQSMKPLAVFSVQSGSNPPAGQLILLPDPNHRPLMELEPAQSLAQSLASILAEIYQLSDTLRQREADLAAMGLFSSRHSAPKRNIARRLSAILHRGADEIGCEAAALYLLDPDTTVLKLRSLWGLPEERLTEPPRSLSGAMADLEAMLGNAVVLNEAYLRDEWNAPEMFSASVCVPVMSDSTVLGTIWFFSDIKRKFSDKDLSAMEWTSSRVALELERSLLAAENSIYKQQAQQKEQNVPSPAQPIEQQQGPFGHLHAEMNDGTTPQISAVSQWQQAKSSKGHPGILPHAPEAERELTVLAAGCSDPQQAEPLQQKFQHWVSLRPVIASTPCFCPQINNTELENCLPESVKSMNRPEKQPENSADPSADSLEAGMQQEAEELLSLLKQTVARRGRCKSLTLFVMKPEN